MIVMLVLCVLHFLFSSVSTVSWLRVEMGKTSLQYIGLNELFFAGTVLTKSNASCCSSVCLVVLVSKTVQYIGPNELFVAYTMLSILFRHN